MAEDKAKHTLYCSFCGKSQREVKKLVAESTVFICNECVVLCMEIMGPLQDEATPSLPKQK